MSEINVGDRVGEHYDLAVVGAGPAGMSAAVTARARGLSVVLLDEQEAVGGQIYRNITRASHRALDVLGPDYASGARIADSFQSSGAVHLTGASVWQVGRDGTINYLRGGKVGSLHATQIVLASGAMERPFPIPGWTLPGVLGAGAAQILLKSADLAPSEPVVLAGCGPLLYLLGWQYLRAGVPIKALIDTTDTTDYVRAAGHLVEALAAWPTLKKGLKLMSALKKGKVPFYRGATNLAVQGTDAATGIRFTAGGKDMHVDSKVILLHQGVVPNTQFTWSLRAKHTWNDVQLCWTPEVDAWGKLEGLPNIYVAGDGMGIGGALAAALQGQLSGLEVAAVAGKIDAGARDSAAAPLRAELTKQLRIRPFLDVLYRPKDANRMPADAVAVCRCEEVTAGDIRGYVALGCSGPNQTKSFGRCGMGPCQGRLCGLTVTEVIAQARGVSPSEVGYYRIRPPIKPVTLGELANEA